MLFIPAIIARLEATKFIYEWERLISQSNFMFSMFNEVLEKIQIVKSKEDLNIIIKEINENMSVENIDWEFFTQNKNHPLTPA